MQLSTIAFYKMSGSGNDFILIDNRSGILNADNLGPFVASVCRRKHAVGADGLILLENSEQADFKWRFFNADGGEVDMCGNGGRCAARLAYLSGITGPSLTFETRAGIIQAEVRGERVKLEMPQPTTPEIDYSLDVEGEVLTVSSITVGVPHVVTWVTDTETTRVFELGRAIRYHERYAPAGTNANFVKQLENGAFAIRTYERGVEDETLACGTGSVAAALIAAVKGMTTSPAAMQTRGGETLNIHFEQSEDGFKNVFLEGDARLIYEGKLSQEVTEDN